MVARTSLTLLLVVLLMGCRPASPTPTAAPVISFPTASDVATATEAPTPSPDAAVLFHNAQYQLGTPDTLQVVQLKDGKFERGAPGDTDYASVQVTNFVASGDLNSDGKDEIAALISENYGGSGVFVFLAIFNDVNGTPTYLASTLIDDRPQLNALSIKNNEVFLDATIHGLDEQGNAEPMCCPTWHTTRNYRLVHDQLDMSSYTTFTPDGKPRTITIASPVNGTEVFSSVQVKGSVSIAPFENTLSYSIKDGGGVELSRGAIPVIVANPGGPGTFDAVIALGKILSSTVVFVEIQDISAANGSLLGMDSLELVVK